jgi:excisionase family DNA binding protein
MAAPDPDPTPTVTAPAPSMAGLLEALDDVLAQARDLAASSSPVIECGTYTIPEAARRLGISRRLAYDLAHRHEFPVPVLRVGERMLVPRTLLERFIGGDPDPQPRLRVV